MRCKVDKIGYYQELDAIYEKLPKLECKGKCQWYCRDIDMSGLELERIRKRFGYVPKVKEDGSCPLLNSKGQCDHYHIRPLICRLWGVVENMRCPWNCKPERYLTRDEGKEFMEKIGNISLRWKSAVQV